MNTDRAEFGGKDRLKGGEGMNFPFIPAGWCNRPHSIKLYIPSRTAIVLVAVENIKKYDDRMADRAAKKATA